jgi:hypothetical protein
MSRNRRSRPDPVALLHLADAKAKEAEAFENVRAELLKEGTATEADIEKIIGNLQRRGRSGSWRVHAAEKKIAQGRAERFGVGLQGDDTAEVRRKLRNARKKERRDR